MVYCNKNNIVDKLFRYLEKDYVVTLQNGNYSQLNYSKKSDLMNVKAHKKINYIKASYKRNQITIQIIKSMAFYEV